MLVAEVRVENAQEMFVIDDDHVIQTVASDGYRSRVPQSNWRVQSTAPAKHSAKQRFQITHPYHPLFQQEFELVQYRRNWGEEKKTPMSRIPSAMCGNNELVGQYEELRRQVL